MNPPLLCITPKSGVAGYATLCVLVMTVGALASALYAWRLVSMASDLHTRHVRSVQLESVVHTLTVLAARGVQQQWDRCSRLLTDDNVVPIIITSCVETWCPPTWGLHAQAWVKKVPENVRTFLVVVKVNDHRGMQLEGKCLVIKEGEANDAIISFDGLCTGAAA